MRILASLVGGLDIRSVDISVRVGMGLRGSIGVIFVVEAGGSITDSSTIQRRFLLNGADAVGANMFINYTAGTADQFGTVFKGVGVMGGEINFVKVGDCVPYKASW